MQQPGASASQGKTSARPKDQNPAPPPRASHTEHRANTEPSVGPAVSMPAAPASRHSLSPQEQGRAGQLPEGHSSVESIPVASRRPGSQVMCCRRKVGETRKEMTMTIWKAACEI